MKTQSIATVCIALGLIITPAFAKSEKCATPDSKKSPAKAETIPWPFQINSNGFEAVEGKLIEYGTPVSPGTTVVLKAVDVGDPGNAFVGQLVGNRWTAKDLPLKNVLWAKSITRGPWEARVVSLRPEKAPKAKTDAGTANGATAPQLWRVRLEVRMNKHADPASSPVEELRVGPRETH